MPMILLISSHLDHPFFRVPTLPLLRSSHPPYLSARSNTSLLQSAPKSRRIPPFEGCPAQRNASSTRHICLYNEEVLALAEGLEKSSHNRPEGRVSVRFSSMSFENLMEKLNYRERDQKYKHLHHQTVFLNSLILLKYPRYFYNSSRSEMTIQCVPIPCTRESPCGIY